MGRAVPGCQCPQGAGVPIGCRCPQGAGGTAAGSGLGAGCQRSQKPSATQKHQAILRHPELPGAGGGDTGKDLLSKPSTGWAQPGAPRASHQPCLLPELLPGDHHLCPVVQLRGFFLQAAAQALHTGREAAGAGQELRNPPGTPMGCGAGGCSGPTPGPCGCRARLRWAAPSRRGRSQPLLPSPEAGGGASLQPRPPSRPAQRRLGAGLTCRVRDAAVLGGCSFGPGEDALLVGGEEKPRSNPILMLHLSQEGLLLPPSTEAGPSLFPKGFPPGSIPHHGQRGLKRRLKAARVLPRGCNHHGGWMEKLSLQLARAGADGSPGLGH